ncbi:MAG: DUF2061 domain-containing protein [Promethearchaeota archaeon]
MKLPKIEWKESLIKSLIYRALTLLLGTLTAYIITGSIAIATGTAILTESVQSLFYFGYELSWSNISRRKLEKKLIDQIKKREITLKLDFSFITELAYHLSQIDTFIPDLYISIQNVFNKMLKNEELEEIHEEIEKYKNYFDVVHSGRKLFFLKDKE